MQPDPAIAKRNRRTAKVVGLVITGMFGFSFALIPLYGMLCRDFGIGAVQAQPAKPGNEPTKVARYVTIHFIGQVNDGLNCAFGPLNQLSMRVKVGQMTQTSWRFRNLGDTPVTFQAVHNVVPERAQNDLQKIECFCFTRQTLAPHEARTMPLVFRIEPTLAADVQDLSLGYTLCALDPDKAQIQQEKAKQLAVHKASS